MRLHHVKLRGLGTPFRDREVEIDFDALPKGLVAFIGPNGGGKSTLMSACGPLALYLSVPSYGWALKDHVAPGVKNARLEVDFSVGERRLKVIAAADPTYGRSGKTEHYLSVDGVMVSGPGVIQTAAEIRKYVPSETVFNASVFAGQGGVGSFLALPPGERKAFFIELLMLAHLQEQAERARQRGQLAELEQEALARSIESLRARAARAQEVKKLLEGAVTKHGAARAAASEAQGKLEAVRTEAERVRASLRAAEQEDRHVAEERTRVDNDLARIEKTLRELLGRHDQLRKVAEIPEHVKESPAALARYEEQLVVLRHRKDEMDRAHQEAEHTAAQGKLDVENLRGDYRLTTKELEDARRAKTDVDAAGDLDAQMGALRARYRELVAQVPALREGAVARRELTGALAHITEEIPELDQAAKGVCERCPISGRLQTAVAKETELRALIAKIPPGATEEALGKAERELADIQAKGAGLKAQNEALAEKRVAMARLPELERHVTELRERGRALKAREVELEAVLSAALDAAASTKKELGALVEKADLCRKFVEKAHTAEKAEAALESIVAEAARLEAEQGELRAQQKAAKKPADLSGLQRVLAKAEADVETRKSLAEKVEEGERELAREVARLEGELGSIGKVPEELALAEGKIREISGSIVDWQALARALGRDGVQALEIDAAGPGVSSRVNELLHAVSPRFSLRLETTAAKKSGGQKEVFDAVVIDSEAGREGTKFSGGEQVLIEQAMRLGFALFNRDRSGFDLRTVFQDEFAGALDPENADAYVRMLRAALRLGDFHQCVFISHSEAVWRQADARVHFEDGRLRVE